MERRDILKASALFLGYSLTGGAAIAVLNGCKADKSSGWSPSALSVDHASLIAEIAERIIPRTDTPGAKDALVDRYIDEALKSNYSVDDKQKFMDGIALIDKITMEKYGKSFVKISDVEKDQILQSMADRSKSDKEDEQGKVYRSIKDIVVSGYFTSEEGATKALIYDPIPGPFQGCIPLSSVGGLYSL